MMCKFSVWKLIWLGGSSPLLRTQSEGPKNTNRVKALNGPNQPHVGNPPMPKHLSYRLQTHKYTNTHICMYFLKILFSSVKSHGFNYCKHCHKTISVNMCNILAWFIQSTENSNTCSHLCKLCDYEKENFIFKSPIIDSKLMGIKNNNNY